VLDMVAGDYLPKNLQLLKRPSRSRTPPARMPNWSAPTTSARSC